MPYRTQLADVARRTGFPVTEVAGWRTRGHGPQPAVRGVVAHHTAGQTGGGDYPTLAVVRDGYAGLPGPLSQFGLGRSGRIYVIAAGRCYHNAPSTSPNHTNSNSLGIEAENDGSQPWPADQLRAYYALCGELCREFNLPVSAVMGHKEVNTGKGDPHSLNMNTFRNNIQGYLDGEQEDDVPEHIRYRGRDLSLVIPPDTWRYVPFNVRDGEDLEEFDYSVAFNKVDYVSSVSFRFDNTTGPQEEWAPLDPGSEVQVRAVHVHQPTGSGPWEVATAHPLNSPVHASGNGHFTHTWNDRLPNNRRLRFQIKHFSSAPALLGASSATVHTWKH